MNAAIPAALSKVILKYISLSMFTHCMLGKFPTPNPMGQVGSHIGSAHVSVFEWPIKNSGNVFFVEKYFMN